MIKKRLGLEVVQTPGAKGQFDVIVDGQRLSQRGGNWLTRSLGLGYPNFAEIVAQIESHRERAQP